MNFADNKVLTPFFIIHKDKIDKQVLELKQSLSKKWAKNIIGYSFKTNNLPWLIGYMKSLGLWAEVVSSDEYNLAKSLGYLPERIIFNGPVKGKEEFIDAVENNAIVNIDSHRELEWLLDCKSKSICNCNIGLRVYFCLENYCPGETQCGKEDGRFGFSLENGELDKAIKFLEENNIPLSGLHLHCSSKTRSLNIYRSITQVAANIIKSKKLNLKYIDVGGGFFGGMPEKPSFGDYCDEIYRVLKANNITDDMTVIVEPGMSIVGAYIDYVTSVVDIKHTLNNRFYVLDGSRIHIDPLMKKSKYKYHIESSCADPVISADDYIFCGFTCMENDRFFSDNKLLSIGDRVVFEKVGAYTMGLSPQFIEFYPQVYVSNGEKIETARKKITASEFIKLGE